MMRKNSSDLRNTLIALGLVALGIFLLQIVTVVSHGAICNYSSADIWLTVSEADRQKAAALDSGECTNFLTQDAEAVWGRDCHAEPCRYQAWKVGAGHYEVYDGGSSSLDNTLRIEGWGAGSSWHITSEWPKPALSSVDYSLMK